MGMLTSKALASHVPILKSLLIQNNYNVFGNDVTGDTMIEMAKSIKSTGLQALGYNYIMMDDVWTQGRDGAGNLVPLAKKFPNGVAAIADELHSMGFKWGMYSDAGSNTCAGNGKLLLPSLPNSHKTAGSLLA